MSIYEPAIETVTDEIHKRWASMVAREQRFAARVAALDGAQMIFIPSASPARGLQPRSDEVTGPSNLERWERLARDIEDLGANVPTGKGPQTYLRAILLTADHTSYHVGQLVAVRRALGIWPSS